MAICGSGVGACIAANKVRGVRAALCTDAPTAAGARRYNDANVLALSANLTNPICSPGTEIFNSNTSTDLLFFSVQNNGAPASCGGGGCVMSFNITSGFPAGISAAAPATGGTSGITIDNIVPSGTTGQASSIYYITLANQACTTGSPPNGGCAVKLTQSNLN